MPHWPRDVLDLLVAEIVEREIEPVAHLITDHAANANPARLGECLQAGCHVDPVPEDVVLIGNHVAEVDADAKVDPLGGRSVRIPLDHPPLHLDSAANSGDHARELCKEPIASVLNDPTAVLSNLGVDQLSEVRP